MIRLKSLFINILIPNLFGVLGTLLGNPSQGFNNMIKPNFTPSGIIFPIAWIILYTLMGISCYLVLHSESNNTNSSLIVYGIQLIVNSLWTLFFFRLQWYLFSFVWIIILIILVAIMIYQFYKSNKIAAYLQIPYLVWLIFASILNYSVYLLN